jgi:hypothetical protein
MSCAALVARNAGLADELQGSCNFIDKTEFRVSQTERGLMDSARQELRRADNLVEHNDGGNHFDRGGDAASEVDVIPQ